MYIPVLFQRIACWVGTLGLSALPFLYKLFVYFRFLDLVGGHSLHGLEYQDHERKVEARRDNTNLFFWVGPLLPSL